MSITEPPPLHGLDILNSKRINSQKTNRGSSYAQLKKYIIIIILLLVGILRLVRRKLLKSGIYQT